MTSTSRKAFSLIELVIVIVILAVISAIAVPRISRGAKGADEAALGQNLAVLRSAIEMYAAEHGGAYPGAAAAGGSYGDADSEDAFINQLTMYTDRDGTVSDTKTGDYIYGPYLHQIPPVPVGTNAGKSTVTVGTDAPAVGGDTGWVYSTTSGKIIANSDGSDESGSRTYDEW